MPNFVFKSSAAAEEEIIPTIIMAADGQSYQLHHFDALGNDLGAFATVSFANGIQAQSAPTATGMPTDPATGRVKVTP